MPGGAPPGVRPVRQRAVERDVDEGHGADPGAQAAGEAALPTAPAPGRGEGPADIIRLKAVTRFIEFQSSAGS